MTSILCLKCVRMYFIHNEFDDCLRKYSVCRPVPSYVRAFTFTRSVPCIVHSSVLRPRHALFTIENQYPVVASSARILSIRIIITRAC